MKVIEGLYYSKDHEWIRVDGDRGYIGISDFAQHALGDIVFVELPEVDSEFSESDTFGTVESVKAASDVLIPVSGKVVEVNEAVVDDPALLNADAFENWMICVEIADMTQLNGLMSAAQYEEFCSREA